MSVVFAGPREDSKEEIRYINKEEPKVPYSKSGTLGWKEQTAHDAWVKSEEGKK